MHPDVQALIDASVVNLDPEMRKKSQNLLDQARSTLEGMSPLVATLEAMTNPSNNAIGRYVAALWMVRILEAADEAETLRAQNEALLTRIAELEGDVDFQEAK